MKKQLNFHEALAILAITKEELDRQVNSAPLEPEETVWERRTELFHKAINKARQEQMRRYHPDVCKEEGALAKSQEINDVADMLIKHIKVAPRPKPPPRPAFQVFHVSFNSSWTNTSTWTSATGGTGTWGDW